MESYDVGSKALGRIHARNNDKKYFCHLTGFLEGILASGYLEKGEVEPLIAECEEFVRRISDNDADDIVQDFHAELLDFDTISACVSNRSSEIDKFCEKSSLNRFLGFCRGVVCDGKIRTEEAKEIVAIVEENSHLLQVIGVKQIRVSCIDAIEDGFVDEDESLQICKAISEVVGDSYGDTGIAGSFGVAEFPESRITSIDVDFIDRAVVLTGSFTTSPRSHLEDKLRALGAEVSKSVSGKTFYIVIGGEASRDWIEMNRGTKIRKAQELRLVSKLPHFISETQLLRLLGD